MSQANNFKHALVTGASTGIGRSIALAFADKGIFVYLTARNKDGLATTKKLIEEANGKADIIQANLANTISTIHLIEALKDATKRIDILVNVAGIWHDEHEVYAGKAIENFSPQIIQDTYFVGTITPTLLAQALIPLMPENGKILNISGTFESGAKGWLPYFVSKRAIEDLTVGLAQELRDKNIQVNCISPSDVATEQYQKYFPEEAKNAMDPEEIARQAIFLCSDEANEITGKVFVMKKGSKPHEDYHA